MDIHDEDEPPAPVKVKKSEPKMKRRPLKKPIPIPGRKPSIVIPEKEVIFPTPDKTTCKECPCFPKEDPWVRNKPSTPQRSLLRTKPIYCRVKQNNVKHLRKLYACQRSPLTLYEYSAAVVDKLKFPQAFEWSMQRVAEWFAFELDLPDYQTCIIVNRINGLRLLMLEDPSHLPRIGVTDFDHVKVITSRVRKLFGVEFVRFARSIGLPPRKPLTHCTWFKSRTGPTWGIRTNWSRCDVLRWMKIIMPEPVHLDHWDLVWYHKPDFPAVKFGRVPGVFYRTSMPTYYKLPVSEQRTFVERAKEIQVPRRFRLIQDKPEYTQLIWMEVSLPEKKKKDKPRIVVKETNLHPKPVSCEGLRGDQLLLARRKQSKPKFFPETRKAIKV